MPELYLLISIFCRLLVMEVFNLGPSLERLTPASGTRHPGILDVQIPLVDFASSRLCSET